MTDTKQILRHEESFLRKHLPSIYVFVAVALTAAYFTFSGFAYWQWERVVDAGSVKSSNAARLLLDEAKSRQSIPFNDMARVALEHDAAQMRASHVRSMILMRTWLRFMSVMVGSVIAVIGALFVFGRINAGGNAGTMNADLGGLKVLVTTTWPGLMLATMGTVLVAIPNVVSQEIQWHDANTCLSG